MSMKPSAGIEFDGAIISVDQQHDVEATPSVEELTTLKRVSDRFPLTAWLIIIGEFCEGFTFYGTLAMLQNYIQFPVPDSENKQPGALNLGQRTATLMTALYFLFCHLTPIVAAIIADQFWGKYKTLVVASFIYLSGLIVLTLTSIPMSINAGVALPGLILAMILLGIAAGAVKSTVSPTIESLYNWLYWAINWGALISMATTTTIERYHSFWLAYLIALIIFPGFILVLLIGRCRYFRVPPTGSQLVRAFRVTIIAIRNRWKMGKQSNNKSILDYAKRVVPSDENLRITIQSENQFIDDLKQVIHACRVFAFFPFYWVCYNQVIGNLISQAAQMNVGPIPNDILQLFNPLSILVFIPIFDKIIYPILRRCNIKFNSVPRITCGFFVVALAMAWTAIVQHLIYSRGPNFNYETKPCSTCQTFNNLTVAWQIPSYLLVAISEILAVISGLEYAFTNAPSTMKSIVVSLFHFATAIGCILNLALVPVSVDPSLLWMYTSLSIVTFVIGIIFYIVCQKNNTQTLLNYDLSHRRSSLRVNGF
ncbi:unnamed protein product [Adineta steineri]|uniref:Uncharacterized protein n=1 Tax=Adineta steineri TaxID=433720 RepID=A0A815P7U4_9BILA|nr:unnamed protein product [Adineta steineri]